MSEAMLLPRGASTERDQMKPKISFSDFKRDQNWKKAHEKLNVPVSLDGRVYTFTYIHDADPPRNVRKGLWLQPRGSDTDHVTIFVEYGSEEMTRLEWL
jgi:hypothetical protein